MKILKAVYKYTKTTIELVGFMFLTLLVICSIASLKGESIEELSLPLSNLVKNDLPYIYCGLYLIYVTGAVVEVVIASRKMYRDAKGGIKKSKEENKPLLEVFWGWFKEN